MSERIGVLGGTFDPIHYGHLAIAEEARVALRLSRVLFVPAGRQPLKHGSHVATPEQRLHMARLACQSNPAFSISALEVERPGLSYTVDTLAELRAAYGAELHFILGADTLADLHRWRHAEQLPQLARLVAMTRPGHAPDLAELAERLPATSGRVTLLESPRLDISSSDVRRRVAEGRPIRYLTPDAVVDFIAANRLYHA